MNITPRPAANQHLHDAPAHPSPLFDKWQVWAAEGLFI